MICYKGIKEITIGAGAWDLHDQFIQSTGEIRENKHQGYASYPFLKIDEGHWDPNPDPQQS